jgi:hypothetical protein
MDNLSIKVFWRTETLKPKNQFSNLDGRQRNANGEIDRKHSNTLVRTLRETYGEDFAAGNRADMKLSTLLRENGVIP